jgi:hypothetical protein
MILCPKCQQKLPDGAGHCQFCHATFAPIGSAAPDPDGGYEVAPRPTWIGKAYNAIAIWWIVSGLYGVLEATVLSRHVNAILLVFELITVLIGVGLLLKIEAARGVLNILCFLQILGGAFGLLIDFFSPFLTGILGFIAIFANIISIGLAMLMIYLIGETETRAPNF